MNKELLERIEKAKAELKQIEAELKELKADVGKEEKKDWRMVYENESVYYSYGGDVDMYMHKMPKGAALENFETLTKQAQLHMEAYAEVSNYAYRNNGEFDESKSFYIYFDGDKFQASFILNDRGYSWGYSWVKFSSREIAKQAIEDLPEETLKHYCNIF